MIFKVFQGTNSRRDMLIFTGNRPEGRFFRTIMLLIISVFSVKVIFACSNVDDFKYVEATVTTKVTAKAISAADPVNTASGTSRYRAGRTNQARTGGIILPWRKERILRTTLNGLTTRVLMI